MSGNLCTNFKYRRTPRGLFLWRRIAFLTLLFCVAAAISNLATFGKNNVVVSVGRLKSEGLSAVWLGCSLSFLQYFQISNEIFGTPCVLDYSQQLCQQVMS